MMFIKFIALFISCSLFANDDINQNMNKMAKEIDSLAPLIYSKTVMPKDKEILEEKLKKMISAFGHTQKHFKQRGTNYFLTFSFLDQHLKSTLQTVQNGNLDFSLTMLRSVPLMCMNCHSGDHQSKTIFTPQTVNKLNSWGRAEIAFMTRDYAEAKISYLNFLKENPNSFFVETALTRLLTLSLHEDISYQISLKFFSELLNKPFLSKFKGEIKNWIVGLKFLQRYELKNKLEPQWKSIEKFVVALKAEDFSFDGGFAEDQKLVYALKLNLLTHSALDLSPKDEDVPKLLLTFAQTEMVLRSDLFYTLADVSLKYCLKKYPSSKVAKDCFAAYKDYLEFSYTGSGGTHIPKEIEKELESYQKLITR